MNIPKLEKLNTEVIDHLLDVVTAQKLNEVCYSTFEHVRNDACIFALRNRTVNFSGNVILDIKAKASARPLLPQWALSPVRRRGEPSMGAGPGGLIHGL